MSFLEGHGPNCEITQLLKSASKPRGELRIAHDSSKVRGARCTCKRAEVDPDGDIVVTLPRGKLKEWIDEGDAAGDEYSGGHWAFHMGGRPPKKTSPGNRVYVVYDGHLIGYAPLVRVDSDVQGTGFNLVRGGDAVAVTIDEPCPGFRGYRYRWWPREAEREFPDWKKLATTDPTWRCAKCLTVWGVTEEELSKVGRAGGPKCRSDSCLEVLIRGSDMSMALDELADDLQNEQQEMAVQEQAEQGAEFESQQQQHLGRKVYAVKAYHGTEEEAIEAFDPELSGLGTHFGTYQAAVDRGPTGPCDFCYALDWQSTGAEPVYKRLKPGDPPDPNCDICLGTGQKEPEPGPWYMHAFELAIKNPLDLPDLSLWEPKNVAANLTSRGVMTEEEADAIDYSDMAIDHFESMRAAIERAGYDSVRYVNAVEAPGSTAYIVWNNALIQPLGIERIAQEGQYAYHVTTDLPAVLESGQLLSRQDLGPEAGGLGGGAGTHVSVTVDLETAQRIERRLKHLVELAKLPKGEPMPEHIKPEYEALLAEAGDNPTVSQELDYYLGSGDMFGAYRTADTAATTQRVWAILGRREAEQLDLDKIGIVRVPLDQTELVSTDDARSQPTTVEEAQQQLPLQEAFVPSRTPAEPLPEEKTASDDEVKKRVTWRGLDICIEVPGGDVRYPGDKYETYVPADWVGYGYFEGLPAEDGDSLDAIVGPSEFGEVYLAIQTDPDTGMFTQYKVMLAFASEAEAEAGYKLLWPEHMFGGIFTIPLEEFREIVLDKLVVEDDASAAPELSAEQRPGSDAPTPSAEDSTATVSVQDVFEPTIAKRVNLEDILHLPLDTVVKPVGLGFEPGPLSDLVKTAAKIVGQPCPHCGETLFASEVFGSDGRWFHRPCTGKGPFDKAGQAYGAWVDPQGAWHDVGGEHARWAQQHLFGEEYAQVEDRSPAESAQQHLLMNGWIRIAGTQALQYVTAPPALVRQTAIRLSRGLDTGDLIYVDPSLDWTGAFQMRVLRPGHIDREGLARIGRRQAQALTSFGALPTGALFMPIAGPDIAKKVSHDAYMVMRNGKIVTGDFSALRVMSIGGRQASADELPRNTDGTVTVYHASTPEAVDAAVAAGAMQGLKEPDAFFTTPLEEAVASGYGAAVLAVDFLPEELQIDDEFPSGRQDWRVSAPSRSLRLRNPRRVAHKVAFTGDQREWKKGDEALHSSGTKVRIIEKWDKGGGLSVYLAEFIEGIRDKQRIVATPSALLPVDGVLDKAATRELGQSLEDADPSKKGMKVPIYRGVVATVTTFNPNDYVTLSFKWAREHAQHTAVVEEEDAIVLRARVPAAQVFEAYNPGEYFYGGPSIPGTVAARVRAPTAAAVVDALDVADTWTARIHREARQISAGRLEDAKKKYPLLSKWIDKLEDPTGNQKYLGWAAARLDRATRNDQQMVSSYKEKSRQMWFNGMAGQKLDRLTGVLNDLIPKFHRRRKGLEVKDLYQYRSIEDLRKAVEEAGPTKSELREAADYEVVYEDDAVQVAQIRNKEASCMLGSGTDWCISKYEHDHYEDYTEKGAEFYFFLGKEWADRDELMKLAAEAGETITKAYGPTPEDWKPLRRQLDGISKAFQQGDAEDIRRAVGELTNAVSVVGTKNPKWSVQRTVAALQADLLRVENFIAAPEKMAAAINAEGEVEYYTAEDKRLNEAQVPKRFMPALEKVLPDRSDELVELHYIRMYDESIPFAADNYADVVDFAYDSADITQWGAQIYKAQLPARAWRAALESKNYQSIEDTDMDNIELVDTLEPGGLMQVFWGQAFNETGALGDVLAWAGDQATVTSALMSLGLPYGGEVLSAKVPQSVIEKIRAGTEQPNALEYAATETMGTEPAVVGRIAPPQQRAGAGLVDVNELVNAIAAPLAGVIQEETADHDTSTMEAGTELDLEPFARAVLMRVGAVEIPLDVFDEVRGMLDNTEAQLLFESTRIKFRLGSGTYFRALGTSEGKPFGEITLDLGPLLFNGLVGRDVAGTLMETLTHEVRHAADWAYRTAGGTSFGDEAAQEPGSEAYYNEPTELYSYAGNVAERIWMGKGPGWRELSGQELVDYARRQMPSVMRKLRQENFNEFMTRVVKGLEQLERMLKGGKVVVTAADVEAAIRKRLPPKNKLWNMLLDESGLESPADFVTADMAFNKWNNTYAHQRGDKPVWEGGETDAINRYLSLSGPKRVSGPYEGFLLLTRGMKSWHDLASSDALRVLSDVPGFENIRLPEAVYERLLDEQTEEYYQQHEEAPAMDESPVTPDEALALGPEAYEFDPAKFARRVVVTAQEAVEPGAQSMAQQNQIGHLSLRNQQLYERAMAAGGQEVQPGTISLQNFGWVWHPSLFGQVKDPVRYSAILDEVEKRVVQFEQRRARVSAAEIARVGYLRDGKMPGEKAVVVMRVPSALARMFPPELTDENGPPHFTMAYIPGPHSELDQQEILDVVESVARGTPPIPVELEKGVSWFTTDNEEKTNREIAHKTVHPETAERMAAVHWALIEGLEARGFKPAVRDEFKVHSTLAYCPERKYSGPVPEGGWTADALEVWGWPDTHGFELTGERPKKKVAGASGYVHEGENILGRTMTPRRKALLEEMAAGIQAALDSGKITVGFDVVAGPGFGRRGPGGRGKRRGPMQRKKRFVGETYYIRRDGRDIVAYTSPDHIEGDAEAVRLSPDARILKEGDRDWLKMFEDGLPKLTDIIRKAVEEGYDAVRVGEALAILSGVAIAERDSEAVRKRREQRKRDRLGWTKVRD
jgi:hypothetical protein